jgi:hypothetical protein
MVRGNRVFPHVRQDKLERRIETHQCVYQEGPVITYQQYRKRTRVRDVNVPAGAIMLHQIVNSSQFNGAEELPPRSRVNVSAVSAVAACKTLLFAQRSYSKRS